MGVMSALSEPPHSAICVSVILWNVINTGAKKVFIITDIESATTNLPHERPSTPNAATSSPPPILAIKPGIPIENTVIAIEIATPSRPQTTMRGTTPNVGVV